MAASRKQDISQVPAVPSVRRSRLTADTSSQPEGITRRMLLNALEAFFRRPILHLLPLILMVALGLGLVFRSDKMYTSVGTLSVTNESLLADLTDSASTPGVSFEGVATVTADQINELLGTDEFLTNVTDGAGVTTLVEEGVFTRDQLRGWIGAGADGESIVRVGATTLDPELSFRLADSTLDAYRAWVIDADVSQSTSTEVSLEERVAEKQALVNQANEALMAKIQENPDVEIEDRTLADQLDYQRLEDTATRATDQLQASEDALDAARLQTDQASAIVAQRLRLLDEPTVMTTPGGVLKKAVFTVIVFGVLGAMLSLGLVILSASLDRTIRIPNDVIAKFGVDVLAVVPNVSR